MELDYTMLYSVILYVTQLYYAMLNDYHTIRIYCYYCTTVLVFAAWATNKGGSERERGTRNNVQRMQQELGVRTNMHWACWVAQFETDDKKFLFLCCYSTGQLRGG